MAVIRLVFSSLCGGGGGRGRLLPQPILDGPLASGMTSTIQNPRYKHAQLANTVQNIPASQRKLLPSWFQRHEFFTTHECYPSMFVIIAELPPIVLAPQARQCSHNQPKMLSTLLKVIFSPPNRLSSLHYRRSSSKLFLLAC